MEQLTKAGFKAAAMHGDMDQVRGLGAWVSVQAREGSRQQTGESRACVWHKSGFKAAALHGDMDQV